MNETDKIKLTCFNCKKELHIPRDKINPQCFNCEEEPIGQKFESYIAYCSEKCFLEQNIGKYHDE